MDIAQYAQWFRNSTPYIKAHRGRTFVLHLPGESLSPPFLVNLVHDIALMHSLGARIILVHGARAQLDQLLPASAPHKHRRITTLADLPLLQQVCGELRGRLEAAFSTGLPNTPLHGAEVTVATGNLVTARPMGVIDGIDHLYTGQVRRLRGTAIRTLLDADAIVLLSPLGYSPSGQVFNLQSEELAAATAAAVGADKLILLQSEDRLSTAVLKEQTAEQKADPQPPGTPNSQVSQLHPSALPALINGTAEHDPGLERRLRAARDAIAGGVASVHVVSYARDGALLAELYTAGGQGTQITDRALPPVRRARATDLAGIVELIRPLEDSGVLVRRGRDRLEAELDRFFVAELDGIIVGCAALYPFPESHSAEVACVATHEAYRRRGYRIGQRLLQHLEDAARDDQCEQLFVLTTQAHDWFGEHGFERIPLNQLPESKQLLYNYQRNSTVLSKWLAASTTPANSSAQQETG